MTASVQSPEDAINVALMRIGYRLRVGSIWEGSVAARKALDVYAQSRDALLRSFPWGFAERIAAGALSGVAQFPWAFSYAYPATCIDVRELIPSTYVADVNNPLPVQWTIANDAALGRLIWTKVSGISIVFTAQVTDPSQWDTLFIDAFTIELAKKLNPSLGSAAENIKVLMEEEKIILPLSMDVEG